MNSDRDIEFPDGTDPTALPVEYGPKYVDPGQFPVAPGGRSKRWTVDATWNGTPKESKVMPEGSDPAKMLTGLFDMVTAAQVMLEEDFEFSEIPRTLIEIFRMDPDSRVKMGASDRLVKYVKDCMVAGGLVSKIADTVKVRSADGTVAERTVVHRSVLRSFEETNAKRNRVEGGPGQALPQGHSPAPAQEPRVGGGPSGEGGAAPLNGPA